MAIGYIESEFQVLKERSHPTSNNPNDMQHYQLRQRVGSSEPPYIAVYSINQTGDLLTDYLFRYDDADRARLDWANLIETNNVVKLTDLNFIERIEHHHIGYTSCGGIAMY